MGDVISTSNTKGRIVVTRGTYFIKISRKMNETPIKISNSGMKTFTQIQCSEKTRKKSKPGGDSTGFRCRIQDTTNYRAMDENNNSCSRPSRGTPLGSQTLKSKASLSDIQLHFEEKEKKGEGTKEMD